MENKNLNSITAHVQVKKYVTRLLQQQVTVFANFQHYYRYIFWVALAWIKRTYRIPLTGRWLLSCCCWLTTGWMGWSDLRVSDLLIFNKKFYPAQQLHSNGSPHLWCSWWFDVVTGDVRRGGSGGGSEEYNGNGFGGWRTAGWGPETVPVLAGAFVCVVDDMDSTSSMSTKTAEFKCLRNAHRPKIAVSFHNQKSHFIILTDHAAFRAVADPRLCSGNPVSQTLSHSESDKHQKHMQIQRIFTMRRQTDRLFKKIWGKGEKMTRRTYIYGNRHEWQ